MVVLVVNSFEVLLVVALVVFTSVILFVSFVGSLVVGIVLALEALNLWDTVLRESMAMGVRGASRGVVFTFVIFFASFVGRLVMGIVLALEALNLWDTVL